GSGGENAEDIAQALAHPLKLAGVASGERQGGLVAGRDTSFVAQVLAGTSNGEALLVKQLANPQGTVHVAAAIHALAGAALGGPELGEFRLPEAQHVGGQLAKIGDLTDAEVKLVGDNGFDGLGFFSFLFGEAHPSSPGESMAC